MRKRSLPKSPVDWRQVFILTGLMAPVLFLWNTWAVYPLKILVVFFHEVSHAIAAWATGGSVGGIQLEAAQGGVCQVAGGNAFIVLTAGYLGSLVWGGIILNLAARTKADKPVAGLLGVLLLVITAWLVRPVLHFGFLFGALTGVALLASGIYLPQWSNSALLKVIGLTSCLYAVLDIKSDILDRPELHSDAYMLAELTHTPTLLWGVIWIVIAALLSLRFLATACRKVPGRDGLRSQT